MVTLDVETPEAFQRDVLDAGAPTVVLFLASWCPFCQAFGPSFDRRAAESGGRFARVYLDEDDNPLWDRYGVQVVPTLAFFADGDLVGRKDGRLLRGLSDAELESFLEDVEPLARAG